MSLEMEKCFVFFYTSVVKTRIKEHTDGIFLMVPVIEYK